MCRAHSHWAISPTNVLVPAFPTWIWAPECPHLLMTDPPTDSSYESCRSFADCEIQKRTKNTRSWRNRCQNSTIWSFFYLFHDVVDITVPRFVSGEDQEKSLARTCRHCFFFLSSVLYFPYHRSNLSTNWTFVGLLHILLVVWTSTTLSKCVVKQIGWRGDGSCESEPGSEARKNFSSFLDPAPAAPARLRDWVHFPSLALGGIHFRVLCLNIHTHVRLRFSVFHFKIFTQSTPNFYALIPFIVSL